MRIETMKSHQERIAKLGIITTKKGAAAFAKNCDNGDWSHTFGLEPGNSANEAWEYRKSINDMLRYLRKTA